MAIIAASILINGVSVNPANLFDVGDGTDIDRWGNSIAVAAGTTVDITDYTADGFGDFPTVTDIVLTSDGADFTAGVVQVTVHYYQTVPATS